MSEETVIVDLREAERVYHDFQGFYPKKHIPSIIKLDSHDSKQTFLSKISTRILDDISSTCYAFTFKPLLIEFITRILAHPEIEAQYCEVSNVKLSIQFTQIFTTIARLSTWCDEVLNLAEYFMENHNMIDAATIDNASQIDLQAILVAFYRLIKVNRDKYIRFLDPSALNSIISSADSSDINKYLAICIQSIYFSSSEEVKLALIAKHVTDDNLYGYLDGDNHFDFKFFDLFEAQRLSNLTKLTPLAESFTTNDQSITFTSDDFSAGVRIVAGILVPHLRDLGGSKQLIESPHFVPIGKFVTSLRQMTHCVRNSTPVLLVGKAGTGKTFLVDVISQSVGVNTENLIKIHLNQQTDPKLLLGTYTSGSKPNTFEWKNGVLTTAVKEGKWILVEDIDNAPNEVLSILLGLLENRKLVIPSRNKVIRASNGFQLIATITTPPDADDTYKPDIIGLRLWKTLNMKSMSSDELSSLLSYQFPLLDSFSNKFIQMFAKVKEVYESRKLVIMNDGVLPRNISIRDLMKFCRRSQHLMISHGVKSSADLIPDEVSDLIFQEAIECFTSSLYSNEARNLLSQQIGELLEVPSHRIGLQLKNHIPTIHSFDNSIEIGRAVVSKRHVIGVHHHNNENMTNSGTFAMTSHTLRLMEEIAVCVSMCEPVVLVGETGTGKTTTVQEMAKMLNRKLTVINVSQQTEVGDILGGYKPVSTKLLALPIEEDFESLFNRSFSVKRNARFLSLLSKCFNKRQWKNVVRLWQEAFKMAKATFGDKSREGESDKKKRRLNDTDRSLLLKEWTEMYQRVSNFDKQFRSIESSFVFRFVEGALVKAVRNGEWLLLDEINLASPETLDSISDLLSEESRRSILLSEKGDAESIRANSEFRIFACMNPATDVGKRNLPPSIRSMFTEIYVHSPDEDITDLLMIIDRYIGRYAVTDEWIGNDIAELYLKTKSLADNHKIVDGANQKPQFSVRTLTRTLSYVQNIIETYGLRRSIYEGFCMSFLTMLDEKSADILYPLIVKYTVAKLRNAKSVLSMIPPNPDPTGNSYIRFKHYWIKKGPEQVVDQPNYVITPFVEKNLLNLVRATSNRNYPILLEGPTSAGKTSMINYLAKITGHRFVRINNHEHTDLQEYLGSYVSDSTGKLIFKEGVLVEALRKGYWIVLDELNLAPTDVLEALNRLLDDNRELFIPETQETVHPHPEFLLFATQNPPGLYGGRKILSKAFRNRFLELHFDDIPQDDLEIILRERCKIAPSYAKKIVEVYRELAVQRQTTRLFEQKNSFATLRDLFRWAQRDAVGYEQLAANGYMLLAERVRRPEERVVVKQTLEKVMRVKLDMPSYYSQLENQQLLSMKSDVIWTKAMRRLVVLVITALQHHEPILLVGETGCGKTTICQVLSAFMKKELIIVNAHQNIETSDLIGAQRPVRNRSEIQSEIIQAVKELASSLELDEDKITDYNTALNFFNNHKADDSKDIINKVNSLLVEHNTLFEWVDGPLVEAMRKGCHFLLDEISLADDSVLERLNSVLEPERTLLLAEKGVDDSQVIAEEGFTFFATMNPGGDYGKKELSPALRNRFTEIWVPSMEDFDDVRQIVSAKLDSPVRQFTDAIVNFSKYFGLKIGGGHTNNGVISLRDILAWIHFINCCYQEGIDEYTALLHGACMVFIDSLGTHSTSYLADDEQLLDQTKLEFVNELSKLCHHDLKPVYLTQTSVQVTDQKISFGYFGLDTTAVDIDASSSFSLGAPTTANNAMRVVRALLVKKPILLEGSPGVGKTSLICALAKASGNKLTRINLSDQTDLIDLFGSDVPVENGRVGEFHWEDGPFLRAMQRGEWVLLDEMNLASQSVLEGLNACLDHRGEVYIPELDRSFISNPSFRVFAAQNPQSQGGGRKGLPKSFVNRFTVVYVDTLKRDDLNLIASQIYPAIEKSTRENLIKFMSQLDDQVCKHKLWGSSGQPWEFNLRDTLRWLSLLSTKSLSNSFSASDFYRLIIRNRFRTEKDKLQADQLFEENVGPVNFKDDFFNIEPAYVQVKNCLIGRKSLTQYSANEKLISLQANIDYLESMMYCVKLNYPCLLVGPSGSGKTDLIKLCASLVGAKVIEFSMNGDIDSMDILGGFEQSDINRSLSEISDDILGALRRVISSLLLKGDSSTLRTAVHLYQKISADLITVGTYLPILNELKSLLQTVNSPELEKCVLKLVDLSKHSDMSSSSVNFRWFDSLLVRAVEKGYWLVLDNANLCNPSVLDRLNSLLEHNGKLVINECFTEDGDIRCITPHPNFRLFLTSDPKYGELSRAMRNRSVELFIDSLDVRATKFDYQCLGWNPKNDDTDVSDRLQSLTVGEHELPVSSFVKPTDSGSVLLSKVADYLYSIESQDCSSQSVLLEFLPLNVMGSMSRLSDDCTVFSETPSQFMNDSLIALKASEDGGAVNTVFETYQKSLAVSELLQDIKCQISPFQVFNFTINQYVLPLISLPCVSSTEVHYFAECWSLVGRYTSLLDKVKHVATSEKLMNMNALQKSAAIEMGRKVKIPSKFPLFRLVSQIFAFIRNCMIEGTKSENILQTEGYFLGLFDLSLLLGAFIDSSIHFNEPYLRTYQKDLLKWIDVHKSLYPNTQMDLITSVSQSFSSHLKLSRGLSMLSIWNSDRAQYPSTAESWSELESLIQTSQKFDSVAAEQLLETSSDINNLRVAFIDMFVACIRGEDLEQLVKVEKQVRSEMDRLASISSKFLIKRLRYFEPLFTNILSMVEYQLATESKSIEFNDDILMLSSLAGRSTWNLAKYKLTGTFKPYPVFYESLWNITDSTVKASLFGDDFFNNLLKSTNNLQCLPCGSMKVVSSDLDVLVDQLFSKSSVIVADHLDLLQKFGLNWIRHICIIHNNMLSAGLKAKADSLLDFNSDPSEYANVVEKELPYFAGIWRTYFAPFFGIINKDDGQSIGIAWIMLALGCILLYAPDSTVDPAIVEHAAYKSFKQLQVEVTKINDSFVKFRKIRFGDNSVSSELLLPIKPESTSVNPQIYRSDNESSEELINEWSAFIDNSLKEDRMKMLIHSATSALEGDSADDVFQVGASHFISRLRAGYPLFSDINDILIGFVYALKFGLALTKKYAFEKKAQFGSPLWILDPAAVSSDSVVNAHFLEVKILCKNASVTNLDVDWIYYMFLLLGQLHPTLNVKSNQDSFINQSMLALYYRWSLRNMKKEEEESTQQGIYKFKDPTMDAEADFKDMFPEAEDLVEGNEDSDTKVTADLPDEFSYKVSSAYTKMFDSKEDSSVTSEDLLLFTSKDILRFDSILHQSKFNLNNSSVLISVVNMLQNLSSKFSGSSQDVSSFYTYSFTETGRANRIVSDLEVSVEQLFEKWPEQVMLQDLKRICSEFLSYGISTPVYRLLAKIEQIYGYICQWEEYAHSGVSLGEFSSRITALIVDWRKLELSSWSTLLEREEHRAVERTGKWWFYLYEVLIIPLLRNEMTDDKMVDMVNAINIFISQGTYGDYSYRLSLLTSFANHIKLLSTSSLLPDCLHNIVSFYSQFAVSKDSVLKQTKDKLSKDIKDVILLASWKDVNIDALRQSSKRSHKNLYKIVKKYRDKLSLPMKPLIVQGMSVSDAVSIQNASVKLRESFAVDSDLILSICNALPAWKDRKVILKDMDAAESKISKYVANIQAERLPKFGTFASGILDEAASLKKETPSELTKENKALCTSLKTRKRKLLSDTLKDLRMMGLKLHLTTDITQTLTSVSALLSISKHLPEERFKNMDAYFWRMLDLLPRLRAAVSNCNAELPRSSAQKGLAAAETILLSLVASRKSLVEISDILKDLDDWISGVSRVSDLNSDDSISVAYTMSCKFKWEDAASIVRFIPSILQIALDTITQAEVHLKKTFDKSVFSEAVNAARSIKIEESSLFTNEDNQSLKSLTKFLQALHDSVLGWKSTNLEVSFVANFILEWVDESIKKLSSVGIKQEHTSSVEDIDSSFNKICISSVVSVQEVNKLHSETPVIQPTDKHWLLHAQRRLTGYVKRLHLSKMSDHLKLALETASVVSKSDSKLVCAILTHSIPYVESYRNMVATVLNSLVSNYVDLSTWMYKLSSLLLELAQNGFCSPRPSNGKDDDDSGKAEEGTGLANGQGEKNDSKDVEDDEDLSEDAQEDNPEQDNEMNSDEDAKSIEGDMAGNLEDAEGDEDENDSEKSDDEDEDESDLDSEVDDISDSDPNAIDDKMWDDEAANDSKEKQSDKVPENKENDGDMGEGSEDEQKGEKGENEGSNEGEDKEDSKEDNKSGNEEDDDKENEDSDDAEGADDQVQQDDEGEQLEEQAAEGDALDLPEDLNLDEDDKAGESDEENGDEKDMDESEEEDEEEGNKNEDEEMNEETNEEDSGEEQAENSEMDVDEPEDADDEEKDIVDADDGVGEPNEDEDANDEEKEDEDESMENEDNNGENGQSEMQEEAGTEAIEGLGGEQPDEQNDESKEDDAARNESGQQTEGADETVSNEEKNVGSSGGAAQMPSESDEKQAGNSMPEQTEPEHADSSRNKAAESLKQLGDAMKQFHRRRQEINEATNDELVDQKAGERPDEFQHLDDADSENETQALGSANEDEVQPIDEEMAIDDEQEMEDDIEEKDVTKPEATDKKDENGQVSQQDENSTEKNGEAKDDQAQVSSEKTPTQIEPKGQFVNERKSIEKAEDLDSDKEEIVPDEPMETINQETELRPYEEARELWKKADEATRDLTASLSEQLRLILEPTLATKLKGDYKTGKRLNMKRIIPYIASQFRKDKIWMRRTKPSKRQYQIMIAVDNSKSMAESGAVDIAFQSISLVSKALTQLESGQLAVATFGANAKLVHPFEKQFTSQSGIEIFRNFEFDEVKTDVKKLIGQSLTAFREARTYGNTDLWQLQIILSDGVCEDHATLQRLVRKAREDKIMIVFVVIDCVNNHESIMDMSQVSYTPGKNGQLELHVNRYLDTFPFEYYVVVHNIKELPEMLSLILRQYFSEISSV